MSTIAAHLKLQMTTMIQQWHQHLHDRLPRSNFEVADWEVEAVPVNQARGEAAVSQMVGQLRRCEGQPCRFSECLALDKRGGMLQ